MKFPKQNYQDAMILLEVCLVEDMINILFPTTCETTFSFASLYSQDRAAKSMPAVAMLEHQEDFSSEYAREWKHSVRVRPHAHLRELEDNKSHILREASVSAIHSIFGPRVWNAIEKSQLWEWEKKNLSKDTTDCVSMEIHQQQPCQGTFRIRIGFVAGTFIANQLYA